MKPIIGRIFGLDIHGYGTAIALGFLTAVIIGIILGRKKGFQFETIIDVAIFGCIGGLVGAKLGYAILNLRFYLAYPLAFLDFREGYSIVGGLLGGTLAGILYLRKKKLPVWKMADVAAYCIPPAYAIGRVGCLLEGCCYGVESDVPWGSRLRPRFCFAASNSDLLQYWCIDYPVNPVLAEKTQTVLRILLCTVYFPLFN